MKRLVLLLLIAFSTYSNAKSTKYVVLGTLTHDLSFETIKHHGKQLCFFPDKKSAKHFPKTKKMTWFCFSNYNQALKALNLNSYKNCHNYTKAELVVSNYKQNKLESNVFDTVKLERIVKLGKLNHECM